MRLLKLDPATGRKLAETVLDNRDHKGEDLQTHVNGLNMPVGAADILVGDGKSLYLKSQQFDADCKPQNFGSGGLSASRREEAVRHLLCPTGLLDDVWWHRSYWILGDVWKSGAGGYFLSGRVVPAGRPMVFNDAKAYAYARKPTYYRWTTPMEYQLCSSDLTPDIVRMGPATKAGKAASGPAAPPMTRIATDWAEDIPILARAMVLAGKTIFVAGPPDVVDEEAAKANFADPETQAAGETRFPPARNSRSPARRRWPAH